MPRYYRRRYTRVVRPKKRWASNIKHLEQTSTPPVANRILQEFPLVQNSLQISTPTPTVIKVGNFKAQMDTSYTVSGGAAVDVRAFIMFIPEGVPVNSFNDARLLIDNHPEWIMSWKYGSVDFTAQNTQSGTQTINFSTRLKRNLNSGDRISLIVLASAAPGSVNITGLTIGGLVQFWTCAN